MLMQEAAALDLHA
jgi:hypothetical protein